LVLFTIGACVVPVLVAVDADRIEVVGLVVGLAVGLVGLTALVEGLAEVGGSKLVGD
jgi:hypothetical protein